MKNLIKEEEESTEEMEKIGLSREKIQEKLFHANEVSIEKLKKDNAAMMMDIKTLEHELEIKESDIKHILTLKQSLKDENDYLKDSILKIVLALKPL